MDKMSLVSVLFVSVPEELLFIILTAVLVGRKDILNLRIRSNIYKVAAATALTVLCTFILRYVSIHIMLNVLIQLVFFILVYIFVLRLKWYESTVGFMLNLAIYFPLELVGNAIAFSFANMNIEQSYTSDLLRLLFSLPSRILLIAVTVLLYKLPVTLLKFDFMGSFTKNIIRKFAIMHLYLIIAFIQMTMTVKFFVFDLGLKGNIGQPFLWLNIFFTIVLSVILVVTTNKLSNNIRFEKQEQVICLVWFKNLLNDSGNDIPKIKQEINDALKKYEGGLS